MKPKAIFGVGCRLSQNSGNPGRSFPDDYATPTLALPHQGGGNNDDSQEGLPISKSQPIILKEPTCHMYNLVVLTTTSASTPPPLMGGGWGEGGERLAWPTELPLPNPVDVLHFYQLQTPLHNLFRCVRPGQLAAGRFQVSQVFGFGEELVYLTSESLSGKIFI